MQLPYFANVGLGILSFLTVSSYKPLSAPYSNDEPLLLELERRQAPAVIATDEFLRRGSHASAVAGDFLYIDGGDFSFMNNGTPFYRFSSTMLAIDLSQDWINSTVTIRSVTKPSGVPILDSGSLWYHEAEGLLYTGFAGQPSGFNNSPTLPAQTIWTFKPDGTGSGAWNEAISDQAASLKEIVQPVGSLMAYGPDTAWSLGGSLSTSDPYRVGAALPGLVEFNFGSKTFTNMSDTGYTFNGIVAHGEMHYVPSFGPEGIVIAMGATPAIVGGLIRFTTVHVYDPAKQQWLNQTTTGDAPAARIDFCAAGVNSTNGTYEIFVYGGWGGNLGTTAIQYDTINILTLPAFHWISVPYNPQNPRHDFTCNAVGGSQIVTVGGKDSNPKITTGPVNKIAMSVYDSTQDPFAQGLAIFDMTALAWADKYTANAPPYEQSDSIKKFYAQSQQSYAQDLTAGVAALLTFTHFTNSSSTKSSSSSPNPTHTPGPSHTPTGAIAGAVVGGIVLLAIIAGLAICFLKRRNRRRQQGYDTARSSANEDFYAPGKYNPNKQGVGLQEMYHDHNGPGGKLVELDDRELQEMGGNETRLERPVELGAGVERQRSY